MRSTDNILVLVLSLVVAGCSGRALHEAAINATGGETRQDGGSSIARAEVTAMLASFCSGATAKVAVNGVAAVVTGLPASGDYSGNGGPVPVVWFNFLDPQSGAYMRAGVDVSPPPGAGVLIGGMSVLSRIDLTVEQAVDSYGADMRCATMTAAWGDVFDGSVSWTKVPALPHASPPYTIRESICLLVTSRENPQTTDGSSWRGTLCGGSEQRPEILPRTLMLYVKDKHQGVPSH